MGFCQTELHLQQGQKQELLWIGGSANWFESSTGQNIACIFLEDIAALELLA